MLINQMKNGTVRSGGGFSTTVVVKANEQHVFFCPVACEALELLRKNLKNNKIITPAECRATVLRIKQIKNNRFLSAAACAALVLLLKIISQCGGVCSTSVAYKTNEKWQIS